jgi:thioredoxin 2
MPERLLHVVCPSCSAINRIPEQRPAKEAKCGKCHAAIFSSRPISVTSDSFERHIKRNDIPVLTDFWAPWCGPCRMMAPAYERAATILEPKIRLLKLNIDEAETVAARYGIRSIPLIILFRGGQPIAQAAGAMDTPSIVNWVRASLEATGEGSRRDGT